MAASSTKRPSESGEQPIGLGNGLVVAGAVILFASLFFNWWEGSAGEINVSAWTALEVADLILAALAIIAIVLALPAPPGTEEFNRKGEAWLPWLGPTALLLIIASLLTDPPTVSGLSLAFGA